MFLSKNKNKKIVVIVPTEHLKVQWMSELAKHKVFTSVDVEIINSAVKKSEKVDLLILDEVHRYAADSFYEIFKAKNPTLVLGLSATFNRLDGKHELLAKYCPVCDTITVKEAIKNKWLSPYKEYKVLLKPEDIEIYRELNKDFFNLFSYFDNDFNLAMNCVAGIKRYNKVVIPAHKVRYDYAKTLCSLPNYHENYYDTVKDINKTVTANAFSWNRALQARKSYVMNHPLKVEVAKKILEARPNSKAITFSATIKQAEKIKKGFVVHSGKTKRKNRMTMKEFAPLKTGIINTSKSLDEGADIKGLNLAVILCNTSSSTQKTQRIGRVIRFEEGKEAEIFTLVLEGTNEENWYNNSNSEKAYMEINEKELDLILSGKEVDNMKREGQEQGLLFRL